VSLTNKFIFSEENSERIGHKKSGAECVRDQKSETLEMRRELGFVHESGVGSSGSSVIVLFVILGQGDSFRYGNVDRSRSLLDDALLIAGDRSSESAGVRNVSQDALVAITIEVRVLTFYATITRTSFFARVSTFVVLDVVLELVPSLILREEVNLKSGLAFRFKAHESTPKL
jgi:hypothetical protein